jgi:hypothetical protein
MRLKDVASELAALRRPAPFEVDVAERVMARVATLPRPAVAAQPRELGWAGLAAGAAAFASLSGLLAAWPAARNAIGAAALETLALLRALGGASTTVASASRGASRLFEIAGSTAGTLSGALEPLRPFATAASVALAAAPAAAVDFFVLRDLARAPQLEER